MEDKFYIAIITALFALSTAIVQLIITRKNAIKIETLKSKLDISKRYSEELIKAYADSFFENFQDELNFLKSYLKELQLQKEFLRDIVKYPNEYSINTTKKTLLERQHTVIELYSKYLLSISEKTQKTAHFLKNLIIESTEIAIEYLKTKDETKKKSLENILEELNKEHQNLRQIAKDELNNLFEKIDLHVSEKIDHYV
jgi:hypothetical protein